LADDLDKQHLDKVARTEPLSALTPLAADIVAGTIKGRVVIDVKAQDLANRF
jgi:acrylyl-CoA reductase (NADPH)